MADKKNRTQLQTLFKTGAKPSEEDFRDFIDSVLNIHDDGIEKPPGIDTPIKISAYGDEENLLDFYVGDLNTWRLNQKPTGANPGLNIETGGISKLFLESSSGNLGLSTTQPTAKLHIQQSGSQDALRIDDEVKDTTPLVVNGDGKVGIGVAIPERKLQVEQGELRVRASHNQGDADIGTFYAQNLTQGIGIGYNQIAAIGSNKDQDIRLAPKGSGTLSVSSNVQIDANNEILFSDNGQIRSKDNNHRILFRRDSNTLEFREAGKIVLSPGATSGQETAKVIIQSGGDLTVKGTGTSSFAGGVAIAGTLSITDTLSVTGASTLTGNVTLTNKLSIPGNKQIAFTDTNTSNNLKLQLWSGYGLGINGSTLFYAANGNHSWRDKNGANERMLLTTAANGGLAVKGTGESSFAGSLSIGGNVKASGTIYAGGNPLAYENYEIYLRGSAMESSEGDATSLKIANVSISMNNNRGLNTVILNPNGTFKKKGSHDIYGRASRWNDWANWINANAADGDVVAVASRDALRNAPAGGSAETLLRQLVALKAFRAQNGNVRSPYALLFVKGRTGAIEISQPYKGVNAHLKTTYYQLLNYGSSAVMVGMVVMWSGAVANIPFGWALCDGNNGTPDLRDRFIAAAGSSYNPGAKGDADTHTHPVNPPSTSLSINNAGSHSHKFPGDWYKRDFSNGGKSGIDTHGDDVKHKSTQSSGSHSHSGTVNIAQFNSGSSGGANRPKWYALCFIMKI